MIGKIFRSQCCVVFKQIICTRTTAVRYSTASRAGFGGSNKGRATSYSNVNSNDSFVFKKSINVLI